jgi:hypothetical protein
VRGVTDVTAPRTRLKDVLDSGRGVCTMLEQDAGRKDRHEFSSLRLETGVSQTNDPQQGARLIRAFLRITDPNIRLAIVRVVEKMGGAPADYQAVASDSEMPST